MAKKNSCTSLPDKKNIMQEKIAQPPPPQKSNGPSLKKFFQFPRKYSF
jgi:hypothetical protein